MIIKDFIIYDFKNKAARKFNFKDKANIFISTDNTVGKSCILKSLYYTLGIEIKTFSTGWNHETMVFKVHYEHDGKSGSIVRTKNGFYINDEDKLLNELEYSEWLLELLSIELKLPYKKIEELRTPYPSAILLPFYIDQDTSWSGTPYRDTVRNLSMYDATAVPKNIFESFFGMLNVEIFNLKDELLALKSKRHELINKKMALEQLKHNFVNESIKDVYIDENSLKEDIKNYLIHVREFNNKIATYKSEIYLLEKQIDTNKLNIQELKNIEVSTKNSLEKIKHKCSECGSELTIEQSVKRMKLDSNRIMIKISLDELNQQLNKDQINLTKKLEEKILTEDEYSKLINILNRKYNELSLKEYIEEKSKLMSQNKYIQYLNDIYSDINNIDESIKNINRQIRKLQNKQENIKNEIQAKYLRILDEINILFPDIQITNNLFLIFKQISNSGTKYNQIFFCIYILYSSLLSEYSKVKLPLGFDSPIKDEFSGPNSKNIYLTLENYILKSDLQTFTVMLKDKLQFVKDKDSYNIFEIKKPILHEEEFDQLTEEFDVILKKI